eukprot:CAMPEP_0172691470 /NCGR_PEP_ID=MMETSP1074-20121228/24574_1 /TAXON_ID=2916 /ORGANISM="Ceratium fusus, Strain PA161109" /LENGTH=57 /DNA_ID=CAMNT_0013511545 /DNA_START=90 /DNA_END=260 /DNA_ORIENTATION=-
MARGPALADDNQSPAVTSSTAAAGQRDDTSEQNVAGGSACANSGNVGEACGRTLIAW